MERTRVAGLLENRAGAGLLGELRGRTVSAGPPERSREVDLVRFEGTTADVAEGALHAESRLCISQCNLLGERLINK